MHIPSWKPARSPQKKPIGDPRMRVFPISFYFFSQMVKQIRGESWTFGSGMSSPARGLCKNRFNIEEEEGVQPVFVEMPVMEQMRVDVDEDPTLADDSSSDGTGEEYPVHSR